jgi:hypothetical protein
MQFAHRLWVAAGCALALLVSASAVHAQQTKLLPNDTEMVVVFNLQQILKSEVLKGDEAKLLVEVVKAKVNKGLEDKMLDKHLKNAGFDLFKDLTSITYAIPGGRPPEEGFIVLEGKFNADKIEEAAVAAAKDSPEVFRVTKIAGVKTFEISPANQKPMYIGILDNKTMIVTADRADYTEAIARYNGTKKAAFKADVIKSLIGAVNARQSISFVATSKVLAKLAENVPNDKAKAVVAGIEAEGYSIAITINRDLDIHLGLNAKDNETASKYGTLVNAGLKAAREKVAEKAKEDEKAKVALDILRTIEATTKGPNLTIRGQISFEHLDMILKNLPIPQQ